MIFIYLVCFCAVLYYLLTRNLGYWKSRGIPYVKPVPLFGNFFQTARNKKAFFYRIREIYDMNPEEPYVGIHVFTKPFILIRDPGMLRSIMVKNFQHFADHIIQTKENIDPLAHHSLMMAKSEEWKGTRKSLSPFFTSGKMKQIFPLIQQCGRQLKEYLAKHDGEVLNIKKTMRFYAVDVITSCAFGVDSNCLDEKNTLVRDMAIRQTDVKNFSRTFSLLCYFFIPKLVDLFQLKFMDPESSEFFLKMFKESLKQRKEQSIQRNDFINLLQELRDSAKSSFNDEKMAANSIQFFIAGSETSAVTTTYALYELALNKEIQDRLSAEIINAVEKSNGTITYETLQEMKYLDMVVNETLRKYPVLTFLEREVISDFTFEEEGLKVKKGDSIFLPVVGLHYDPKYFPNPEKFDPERFNDENKQFIPPYTFLPFGDGPRICIGQRLGLINVKLGLVSVLQDLEVSVSEETSIPPDFDKRAVFLQISELYLRIKRRTTNVR